MSGTNPGSTSSPFNQLLEVMARHKASDLFISVGSPVQMKINGNMVAVTAADKRLMPQQAEALLRSAINDQQWRRFQEENELNIGYGVKDVARPPRWCATSRVTSPSSTRWACHRC